MPGTSAGTAILWIVMKNLKKYLQAAKTYIAERSDLFVGIGVVAGLVAIVGIIALVVQLSGPRIVYQPTKACELLTPARAQDLLGDKLFSVDSNNPTIKDDVATSKCAYTDQNPDQEQMRIAAVAVRSGINDDGDAKNRAEFAQAKNTIAAASDVKGIGESAFFNASNGQLNILTGHMWLITNYGLASSAGANTLEKATELAHKVLPNLK